MATNSAYRPGGLMRCCILTIQLDTSVDTEGKLIKCPHCLGYLLFKNNAFEWYTPITINTNHA